jgi:MFS family permease
VIGLITASFAVIPLVVALPLGRVADRHRPVGMLAAGVALLAASFLLLGRAGSLPSSPSGAPCSASATWP